MSTTKIINYKPGVVKDDTEIVARPRWADSDRIRFVGGLPQKLGGWAKRLSTAFLGACRGLVAWQDSNDYGRLGMGTHLKLYALEGNYFTNITPAASTGTLTDPFTTANGSTTVTVAHTGHARATGDYVEFSGADAVGGITVDGNYAVTVVDANSYTVEHSASATSDASGGGSVDYTYEIAIGREDAGQGYGYGIGGYGEETYGDARTTGYIVLPPRTWSLDQWGQDLLALPRNGNLYRWQRDSAVRAAIESNAPTSNTAMFVTDEQHCVLLGAGGSKMEVDWCDQSDITNWTASDTATAGSRVLTGGSQLLAGLRVRGTNLILGDGAVWTMTFIGGVNPFGFDQVAGGAHGVVGPNAVVEVGGIGYWLSPAGFMQYDGAVGFMPNQNTIRRFVLDNLTTLQKAKVYAFYNSLYNEIWWLYPTGSENDRYVKFSLDDQCWDVGSLSRTAAVDKGIFSYPMMTGADSGSSEYLYDHESGNDADGAAMNEYIVGSPVLIADGDTSVEVMGMLLDFKTLTGTIQVSVLTRHNPQGSQTEETEQDATSSDEILDFRAEGRLAAIKIKSSATGTDWATGSFPLLIEPGGRR